MTGLDCLREELKKRGLTKAQIMSSTVAVVLDVLSQTGTQFTDVVKAEQELERIKADIRAEKWNLRQLEAELVGINDAVNRERKARDAQLNAKYAKLNEKWDELHSYAEEFNKSLLEAETAEARDRLRIAQMYTNSVSRENGYEETAYSIGLASILCGNCHPISALKAINPKLFDGGAVRR